MADFKPVNHCDLVVLMVQHEFHNLVFIRKRGLGMIALLLFLLLPVLVFGGVWFWSWIIGAPALIFVIILWQEDHESRESAKNGPYNLLDL